jgi:excisionase family DNA binding protein
MSDLLLMTVAQVSEVVRAVVREELANQRDPAHDVLTAEQAAQMLAVHVKTVAKLVVRDGLPAHRLGREYRFHRHEVLAWLEERATRPGAHTSRHGETLRRIRAA